VFERGTDIEEKLAGYGTPYLTVSRTPLVSVSKVEYNGSEVASSLYEIHDASAGELFHTSGVWYWTAGYIDDIGGGPQPGTERKLYTVTHTAGYIMPGNANRDLPADLEQACLETVEWLYHSSGGDPTVESVKLLSYTVKYRSGTRKGEDEESTLPPFVRAVCKRYQRYM
jgi:hypothetical protein